MKFSSLLPIALGLAIAAGASQAQSWSTNFDNSADRDGTFSSLSFAGVGSGYFTLPIGSYAGDAYLAVNDNMSSTNATFSFTTGAATPFFLVSFAALDIGSTNLNVTLSNGSQSLSQAFSPGSTPILNPVQPNTPAHSSSFHFGFGSSGTPWTAGNYTLTFQNGGAPNSFALDDVSVQAVPEPSSYAMMLAALGALAFAARRRQAR